MQPIIMILLAIVALVLPLSKDLEIQLPDLKNFASHLPVFNDAKTLEELREKLFNLVKEAETIQATVDAEHRNMSADEEARFDAALAEVESVKADITRREKLQAEMAVLSTPAPRQTQPADAPRADISNNPAAPAQQSTRPRFTGGEPSGSTRGANGFRSLGEFGRAVRAAVRGNVDQRLIMNAPGSFGSEGVSEDGGFAVPPDFRANIMTKVFADQNLIEQTDKQTTSSNSITFPVDETTPWQTTGGIQAYWEVEGGQKTQSKPELQERTIRLHKLTSLVPVTDELLEDVPALGSYISKKAAEKMTFKVSRAIIAGTGVGQPLGILSAASRVAVAKESSQPAATIVYENLIKMWSRLTPESKKTAIWLVNPDAELVFTSLSFTPSGGTSYPVYLPPGGLAGAPLGTLMGRPVVPSEAVNTLGTEGDIILVDPKQYLSVVKSTGIKSDVSIHLWFDYDVTAFRFVLRVGGAPWWADAINPAQGSAKRSWAVTLQTRA